MVSSEVNQENKVLKENVQKLKFELATQKSMTKHFEGIAHIMMAEMQKSKWIESVSKSERVRVLFDELNNEMRGFLTDKQQMLKRFGRIENIYHTIVAILNKL